MPVNSIDVPAGAHVYSYPRLSTESSGNVTGLLGPDGNPLIGFSGNRTGHRKPRFQFVGESNSTGISNTTVRTTQQAWRFPFDVYGFRFGMESNLAAAATFSLMKGAILGTGAEDLTTAMNLMGSIHSATPFNITWSGSAGATIAARTALDTPSAVQWSDWTYTKILANQVLGTRMLWPYPGSTWYYPYNPVSMPYSEMLSEAANGVAVLHWHDTTDRVTSWTSWGVTVANATTSLSIPYIELLTDRRTLTVAAIGDSIEVGSIDSGAHPLPPVWDACQALSNSSLILAPIQRSWGGKEASQYYNYALDVIANHQPDILFYQVWSQNDTSNFDYKELAYMADVVSRCKKAGITPILVTGIPVNIWSTPTNDAAEAVRLAINNVVRNSGEIVCDMDAALTDGASPANYLAAYGSGTHPNYAGYAAMRSAYQTALREAILQR